MLVCFFQNQMDSTEKSNQIQNVDILSFDGGGSRGIMEVSIMSDVMRLATILWQNPEQLTYLLDSKDVSTDIDTRKLLIDDLAVVTNPLHPNDIYDMIVGTSTGALIAFGLVGGKSDEDGNRMPMTLEECIDMYKEKTKQIFTKSCFHSFLSKIPGLGSIPVTTYSKDNLKEALLQQFGESSLGDFYNCKTIAGAVARQIGQNEKLVLFETRSEEYKLYKTHQVLQATSNAPVYFDTPVRIGDKNFVDGGVGGNCPLAQAIPRAKYIFGEEAKITSAFSVAPPPPKESEVPPRLQVVYWLKYFVELSTNGRAIYSDAKKTNRNIEFRRLAPRGESLKSFKLDETDAEKMLKAMNNEKINNDMFLLDIISMATFVVDTYLRKTKEPRDNTVRMAAKLTYMAGEIYKRKLVYNLAQDCYETSISLRKKLIKDDDTDFLTETYWSIADCLSNQGKYQRACTLLQRTVDYCRKYSNDVNIAKASFKLAECLLLYSRHEEAEKAFMEVLKMQREIYGESTDNPEVATTLNRLGWCLREEGKFDKAIEFYANALEMRKQLYPVGDHLDIAETLESLGIALVDFGNPVGALKYAEDSVEMLRRLTEKESSTDKKEIRRLLAESLNSLGECLLSKTEYEKSEANLEMALTIKKEVYADTDNVSIANTLENIARCLIHTKPNCILALEYAQQALAMKKMRLGDVNNRAIAKTLMVIGRCFEKSGNHPKATKYFMDSMRMMEVVFGPNHPYFVMILSSLGQSLSREGEYEKARLYLDKAMRLEIQRNKEGQLISSLAKELGKCAKGLGEPEKNADYYHQQAMKFSTN